MKDDAENKLINSIYDVTIDPQNYQTFIDRWAEQFLDFPNEIIGNDDSPIVEKSKNLSKILESHILTANEILGKVDQLTESIDAFKIMHEQSPLPVFFIAYDRKIEITNKAARELLKINDGLRIDKLNIFINDIEEIETLLDDLAILESDKILTIVRIEENEYNTSQLFAISKKIEVKSAKCFLKFSAICTVWNKAVGKIIQERFGLTNVELEIAHKLVTGKKLAEIADEKNRSIFTVRTQSKSLLKKTKLKDQSELVQLFAILQNFDAKALVSYDDKINQLSQATISQSKHVLLRENGRKLYYEIYGHPAGKPILFLHSLVTGTDLTDKNIQYLHKHKLKLIAPHRASFGYSDPYLLNDLLFQFVEDVKAVLEVEKIKECKIIGHAMGAFYAYYLGAYLPEKIKAIRIISGAVPFTKLLHINQLHKRQRILTYTGKYTPKLLPFLVKGAAMQLKKYGAEDLIDALYGDSEFDHQLVKDPTYRKILVNGFENSFRHGTQSIINDGRCLHGNKWNRLVANCKVPISLYHGKQNKAVPLQQVIDFVDVHNNLELSILEGGQLIFYKYIEQVLTGF